MPGKEKLGIFFQRHYGITVAVILIILVGGVSDYPMADEVLPGYHPIQSL